MAEWSIAAVLKTVDLQGSVGSNPSLSARKEMRALSSHFFLLFDECISFLQPRDVLSNTLPAKTSNVFIAYLQPRNLLNRTFPVKTSTTFIAFLQLGNVLSNTLPVKTSTVFIASLQP